MKRIDSRKANSQAKQEPASLAARAGEAQKQAETARKIARLAKARFKEARKAYKQAKKFAKQARKEAKAAAKALKQRSKARRLSQKRKATARKAAPAVIQRVRPVPSAAGSPKRSRPISPASTPAHESSPPVSNTGGGISQS